MANNSTRLRDDDAILQMAMDEIINRINHQPSVHDTIVGASLINHTIFVSAKDGSWAVAFDHFSGKILY